MRESPRDIELKWYCLRTKPLWEYRVNDALLREGYETFFPRIPVPYPRRGHPDAPLFPGYLFIKYDLENWGEQSLRRIPGVRGFVRFDGIAPPVPDEVIDEISRNLTEGLEKGMFYPHFLPGQEVEVKKGSFEVIGWVVREAKVLKPGERVEVLLEFLGTLCRAKVPWENLRPLKKDRPPRRTRGKGRFIRGFGPRA